jgi:hypothetical protein
MDQFPVIIILALGEHGCPTRLSDMADVGLRISAIRRKRAGLPPKNNVSTKNCDCLGGHRSYRYQLGF